MTKIDMAVSSYIPPLDCMSIVGKAKRNSGLDLLKTAVSAMWVCMGNDLPVSGFFLFPAVEADVSY